MSDAAIATRVTGLRYAYDQGITREESWRRRQLLALKRMLTEREADFEQALLADLGKPAFEAQLTELGFLVTEIDHTLAKLSKWMRPRRVATPLALQPASAHVVPEPLGVVLILAPWNYPLMLALSPLVGALAAGNAAVVKPSELAPNTSQTLALLLPEYLDRRAVAVIEGGVPETTALLAERFDHIFYTGNGRVGRIIARAAAEHLTPITLELGGKSPVWVDDSVNLRDAAKRIAWAKFVNTGQTCVAPDYVIAERHVLDRLGPLLAEAILQLYGSATQHNPDYGRIISEGHFDRLVGYLTDGVVLHGGGHDRADKFIEPTVLDHVARDSAIMGEEIFGPLLPLVEAADADDAIAFVNSCDKPLVVNVFSERSDVRQRWQNETSSGSLTFGAPLIHLTALELPFGGVGASGYGSYHGERSFAVFSHAKAVMSKPLKPDTLSATVMAPYSDAKEILVRKLLSKLR